MDDKLQKLTSKIYQEGISKGKEEAEHIRKEAEKQAEQIKDDARKEAEKILAEAEKKAGDMQSNMNVELKLTFQQALNSLKQQISGMLQSDLIHESVESSFDDQNFMNELIRTMVENWNPGSSSTDLMVVLPEEKKQEIEKYFKNKAKKLLDKGLTLKFSENMEKGFEIGPKDGSYSISFTDADFEAFIKDYLRPRMISFLFG